MTRLTVRVTPRAGRNAIHGWDGRLVTVRTTAPPVDGRANEGVITLLAKALGIPRSRITLAGGAKSRTKVFDIDGMTPGEVSTRLSARAP